MGIITLTTPSTMRSNRVYFNKYSDVPTGFIGEAVVGSDEYIGDGKTLTLQQKEILPSNILSLGDSIASFNIDLGIGATLPNAASEGFLTWFNNLRGGAHYIQNLATSGYGAQNIIDTSIPALKALALKPKVVFIAIGANDFYANSANAVDVIANMHSVLAELSALNIKAYVLNGFPRENSTVGSNIYSVPKQAQQLAYLQLLPKLVASFNKHVLIDVYSIASSTGDITGTAVNGWSYDGLHPNQKYARAIGVLLDSILPRSESLFLPQLASASDIAGISNGRSKNVSARSTFSYTSLGAGIPAGYTVEFSSNVTGTYLLQANTHGGAFPELKVTLTFTAAGNYLLSNVESLSTILDTDSWIASARLSLDSDINGIVKNIYVKARAEGTVLRSAYTGYARGAVAGPGVMPSVAPFSNILHITAPNISPALNTGARVGVGLDVTGAGVVVFTLSEPAIFRLPAIVNNS